MAEINRINNIYRQEQERLADFAEVERGLSQGEMTEQSDRCLSCAVPFCHGCGCPLDNVIPSFNYHVKHGDWLGAWEILRSTSNFPEFTARVCPALCEGACTSGLNSTPVMIRQIEKQIVETAFARNWVQPNRPSKRTNRSVAVIGAGPAGMAVADELNKAGHTVTVYESNAYPGGLLRYGIPDFKLNKSIITRRIKLMEEAGIHFICGAEIGKDISADYLLRHHDAVVVACGTPEARNLPIPGRELKNIHFALEFLQGQNRVVGGELTQVPINARGRHVVIIGGGDTGSDCVGTSLRQGAASVTQLEMLPQPPQDRSVSTPWPLWPYLLRTSSSQHEGGTRLWSIASKKFIGNTNGEVTSLEIANLEWDIAVNGSPLKFVEKSGSNRTIKADLVLLAMGFTGVPAQGLAADLGLSINERKQLQSAPERGIFVCGDAARGASLVVRAIADAKSLAAEVNSYLQNLRT